MEVTLSSNHNNVKWMLYLGMAIIYAVIQASIVMYTILLMQILLCVLTSFGKGSAFKKECIDLILVSVILPDNYCVILVSALVYLFAESKIRVKQNAVVIIGAALLYIAAGLAVNGVRMPNVIMCLIFMLPFWFQERVAQRIFQKGNGVAEHFCDSLKKVVLIEILATVVFALTHMETVLGYADMDWVTGTLGIYQCNVLMFICSISVLVFWAEYERGRRSGIVWILLGAGLAVATGAVAYTMIFAAAVVMVILVDNKMTFSNRLVVFLTLLFAAALFVLIVPEWVVKDIINMADKEYLVKRVAKLKYYQNTFIEIPKNHGITPFLFGTGLGQYSSRTAATCAGGYIGIYDRFVPPYESMFRQAYISAFDFGPGILALPYASVMSLQGEVGLVGLAAVMAYFFYKLKKAGNRSGKTAIVYFVGLMFVENTLEFAKYGAILWLVYYACKSIDKEPSANVRKLPHGLRKKHTD